MNTEQDSLDAYYAACPPQMRVMLDQVRATIRKAAPEATEKLCYGMPTFFLHENLLHFAACPKHIGLYPTASGVAAFSTELAAYKGAKGSFQLPLEQPLPLDLIRRITEYRVNEAVVRSQIRPAKRRR